MCAFPAVDTHRYWAPLVAEPAAAARLAELRRRGMACRQRLVDHRRR